MGETGRPFLSGAEFNAGIWERRSQMLSWESIRANSCGFCAVVGCAPACCGVLRRAAACCGVLRRAASRGTHASARVARFKPISKKQAVWPDENTRAVSWLQIVLAPSLPAPSLSASVSLTQLLGTRAGRPCYLGRCRCASQGSADSCASGIPPSCCGIRQRKYTRPAPRHSSRVSKQA